MYSEASIQQLVEALAELEHIQWVEWSKEIANTEKLSPERLERWEKLWVAYSELDESEKESDRKWARKVCAVALIIAQRRFDKWAKILKRG